MSDAQQLSLDQLEHAGRDAYEAGKWLDDGPDPKPKREDALTGAKRFVAEYPEAYGLIVKWSRRDIDSGNRPSMHGYLWLLRRMPWIHPGARSYKVDNRWSSHLVDLVIADFPEIGERFERRRKDAKAGDGDATA